MEDRRVRSTGFRVAGQTHVYPLSVRRPGGPESGLLQEGKVEIQQSRRDNAEAIPGPAAGPNGTKLVPLEPPGGLSPPQNGCIWYQ